jgi:hypothetical protein
MENMNFAVFAQHRLNIMERSPSGACPRSNISGKIGHAVGSEKLAKMAVGRR